VNVRTQLEVRSFTCSWDNGGTPPPKKGQSPDTPMLPFLQHFSWAFVQMDPVTILAKIEVRSFTRS